MSYEAKAEKSWPGSIVRFRRRCGTGQRSFARRLPAGKTKRNINSMRIAHKRVTVSLPADLVEQLDRSSRRMGTTRSGLVEEWLRRGARERGQADLDRQIEIYYAGRDQAEVADDESIARAAGRLARRIRIDGDADLPRRARRGAKRR